MIQILVNPICPKSEVICPSCTRLDCLREWETSLCKVDSRPRIVAPRAWLWNTSIHLLVHRIDALVRYINTWACFSLIYIWNISSEEPMAHLTVILGGLDGGWDFSQNKLLYFWWSLQVVQDSISFFANEWVTLLICILFTENGSCTYAWIITKSFGLKSFLLRWNS